MNKLVKAVVEAHKSDPSAPSVVISFLPTGLFYASITRYKKRYGQGKEVVASARNPTLSGCLTSLNDEWTGGTESRVINVPGELSEREIKMMLLITEKDDGPRIDSLTRTNEIYGLNFTDAELKLIDDFGG